MMPVHRHGTVCVLRRDIADLIGTRTAAVAAGLVLLAAVGSTVGVGLFLSGEDGLRPDDLVLQGALGSALVSVTDIPLAMSVPLFTSEPLAREKSSGVIRSMRATPLTSRQIVWGKSLGLWLPALGMSILLTVLTYALGMTYSPDIAVTPSYVVGLAVLAAFPLLGIVGQVDVASLAFGVTAAGGALLALAASALYAASLSN